VPSLTLAALLETAANVALPVNMRDFVRFMFAVKSPAQYIWVNAVRLCSIFPAFIEANLKASDC
jgi:hypothetical protein